MDKGKVTLKKVDLPNWRNPRVPGTGRGRGKCAPHSWNMTSSKHWDLLMEKMDRRYKIYTVDLRGFGASSYRNPVRSIKNFSDDVHQFVTEIKLTDFSIVGWSTGGAVGMQFAADYPGCCNKLVLLASASTRGYPFYKTAWNGLPDPRFRLQTYEEIKKDFKTVSIQAAYDRKDRQFLKSVWDKLIYTHQKPEPARYDEYIEDMLTQRNLAEVYHALNIFNISDKHNGLTRGSNQAKDIRVPVLVLHGDRDLVVSREMTEEILEDLQGRARFVELKNCGHSPLIDDLEQLLRAIEQFFRTRG